MIKESYKILKIKEVAPFKILVEMIPSMNDSAHRNSSIMK